MSDDIAKDEYPVQMHAEATEMVSVLIYMLECKTGALDEGLQTWSWHSYPVAGTGD